MRMATKSEKEQAVRLAHHFHINEGLSEVKASMMAAVCLPTLVGEALDWKLTDTFDLIDTFASSDATTDARWGQ